MKLFKLLLLLPALTLAACTGENISSEEDDGDLGIITEEQFEEFFEDFKMFKKDNVIFESVSGGVTRRTEADNGNMKFTTSEYTSPFDARYIAFSDLGSFDFISYQDDEWTAQHYEEKETYKHVYLNSFLISFDFEDLTRDDEQRAYTYHGGTYEFWDNAYVITNVVIKFKQEKPKSITFDYRTLVEEETTHCEQTFTYGGAEVVLPKTGF